MNSSSPAICIQQNWYRFSFLPRNRFGRCDGDGELNSSLSHHDRSLAGSVRLSTVNLRRADVLHYGLQPEVAAGKGPAGGRLCGRLTGKGGVDGLNGRNGSDPDGTWRMENGRPGRKGGGRARKFAFLRFFCLIGTGI